MLNHEKRILAFYLSKKLTNTELTDISAASRTANMTRNVTFARAETDMEYDATSD